MYVRRTAGMAVGAHLAFLEWARQLGELAKAQPGFQGQVLLNSLGYPDKYTTLQRWESREARRAFARSEEFRAFMRANPFVEGVMTRTRPTEAYEVVLDVVSQGEANYAELWDWTIKLNSRSIEACERGWKELFELRQKHVKGFVAGRLQRFLGDPTRYLVIHDYESREAAQAQFAVPQIQEFFGRDPFEPHASAPPAREAYELVSRVVR